MAITPEIKAAQIVRKRKKVVGVAALLTLWVGIIVMFVWAEWHYLAFNPLFGLGSIAGTLLIGWRTLFKWIG